MSDSSSLRTVLRLAQFATNAQAAELVLDGFPVVRVMSNGPISTSMVWADRSGFSECHADDDVEPWVKSVTVCPITGPSGEPGFVIVGHADTDVFSNDSVLALEAVVELVEENLDRAVEHVRISRLGEVLKQNQDQLRTAQDRLLISNEELEQFAYVAAHELVSPLRAASLYAEVLETLVEGEGENRQRIADCIEAIRSGVSDMDQQVRQLLDLSNIHSDASDIMSFPLDDVVNRAARALEVPLADAGATLDVGDLPVVQGRSVPLQNVFSNLFTNAIRYRHATRPLEINVSSVLHDDVVVVSVADNGSGIAPEAQDRIFRMFERASSTTDGSGIGLALSRRIVESIGGTISLGHSSDDGATFTLSLPVPAN